MMNALSSYETAALASEQDNETRTNKNRMLVVPIIPNFEVK